MNIWHDIRIFPYYFNHSICKVPRMTCNKTNSWNISFRNLF